MGGLADLPGSGVMRERSRRSQVLLLRPQGQELSQLRAYGCSRPGHPKSFACLDCPEEQVL